MVLKILKEASSGWAIVTALIFIVVILASINKTLGAWAGRIFAVVIVLLFILGILSFFISFDKIFKK